MRTARKNGLSHSTDERFEEKTMKHITCLCAGTLLACLALSKLHPVSNDPRRAWQRACAAEGVGRKEHTPAENEKSSEERTG